MNRPAMVRHVILGAGPAGVIAGETLRERDPSARITLVGDEPEPPYSRMALPYYLTGMIDESGTYLRKSEVHYRAHGLVVVRAKAEAIDVRSRRVRLDDRSQIEFDKLLIATGSAPVRPRTSGINSGRVRSCWTLKDARDIAAKAVPGATVVLLGAGFIGCIILEALMRRGTDLHVVEKEDRMVPRMLDEQAGNLVKNWCQDKGIKVYTATAVCALEEAANDKMRVVLNNGTVIDADLVIAATGVRPNIGFLTGSGIRTDFGILVDDYMRTSVPNIFAAGDVCQGRDFSTGEFSVQAIQPTAVEHGRIAALNMSGMARRHRGSVNMNVLDTVGLISISCGLWQGVAGGDRARLLDVKRRRYLCLQFEDDVVVGAQSIGLTQHAGVLRGLIQTALKLGRWKRILLNDPTRFVEAYLANTQAIGYQIGYQAKSSALP